MNRQADAAEGSPQDLHHLHDIALSRANELRQEAMDDFWRGTDAMWAATLAAASRGAQRLGYRLARRARAQASGEMVE